MVDKGSEFTFTLSANAGYKVKALTIGDATYSAVTDNTITKKVKIEKETAISAIIEEEASQPAEQITIGNSLIDVTKDAGGNIITASGNITLDKLKELAEKSTNSVIINTDALTIKSFKTENKDFIAYTISKAALKKAAKALSVLNIENADSTKQTITLDENANIKTISGDISLKDIMECTNEETTEIAKYIAYNLKEKTEPDFDSTNLKINTFNKKRKGNSENIEWEYISTPITPQFLKETKLNSLNKAILNFKDGGISVDVSFASHQGEAEEQKQSDYFDITEFYNEIENGKLQNIKNIPADKVKGTIFLRGERTNPYPESTEDETDYPKASELVKLIENPKLKDNIIVGSVQIAGKLNKLLPLLANGTIKEKTPNSIIFGNANIIPCSGPLWTGFNGWISDTQKESVLKIDELKELCKRTKGHSIYVRNAVIENLNSKDSNQIQDIIFLRSKLANVSFKDSDLSQISIKAQVQGDLKFENTTLPKKMSKTVTDNLILKNVTIPKEEILKEPFAKITYIVPTIKNNLEIHGYVKNSPLEGKGTEVLNTLVPQENMPENYTGSLEIYNKLKKYIYRGEAKTINGNPNPNYHGSIQKPQDIFLALLGNSKAHG